jgi:hypothetical protein
MTMGMEGYYSQGQRKERVFSDPDEEERPPYDQDEKAPEDPGQERDESCDRTEEQESEEVPGMFERADRHPAAEAFRYPDPHRFLTCCDEGRGLGELARAT